MTVLTGELRKPAVSTHNSQADSVARVSQLLYDKISEKMEKKKDLFWLMILEVSAQGFWAQGEVEHGGGRHVEERRRSAHGRQEREGHTVREGSESEGNCEWS